MTVATSAIGAGTDIGRVTPQRRLRLSHDRGPPQCDFIEHRLRSADQLIGLAHPVIKIAKFEFLASSGVNCSGSAAGGGVLRQVCIVHSTRAATAATYPWRRSARRGGAAVSRNGARS